MTLHQINDKPLVEVHAVAHLRALERSETDLEKVLKIFGSRLKERRDALATYREQIYSISTCQDQELNTIMSFLDRAQAGERNDLERWRCLDMKRQSIGITIGRLQKLLGTEKKINHNRNKNKNRAVKKKEKKLQQGNAAESQGDTDNEVEAEEETPFI